MSEQEDTLLRRIQALDGFPRGAQHLSGVGGILLGSASVLWLSTDAPPAVVLAVLLLGLVLLGWVLLSTSEWVCRHRWERRRQATIRAWRLEHPEDAR